jgi:hypothetical protein
MADRERAMTMKISDERPSLQPPTPASALDPAQTPNPTEPAAEQSPPRRSMLFDAWDRIWAFLEKFAPYPLQGG